jgi:hypothetical protein
MVPYYYIALVHLNTMAMLEPWALDGDDGDVDDDSGEQQEFCIGEDPIAILDQYLDEEELKKLIQKRGTFSTTIWHKRLHGLMPSMICNEKWH